MSIEYVFRCRGCGYMNATPWTYQCPACYGFYNINRVPGFNPNGDMSPVEDGQVIPLSAVQTDTKPRTSTGIPNLDHILGQSTFDGSWGFAPEQMIMLYGNPGSGKSTLLLQAGQGISKQRLSVLYVSGEESINQVKERADRIGKFNKFMNIVRETNLEAILDHLYDIKPAIYIIDSLQTIEVDDFLTGSASAINIASRELLKFSKSESIPAFIIVQVGKDDKFAGPKTVDHIFDTTLCMRNNGDNLPRVLECSKNRFGSTNYKARFLMQQNGLIPVPDEDINEKDDDTVATQTAPALTSIPLDLSPEALNKIDRQFPNPNLNSFWTSPDGTLAAQVLAVKCDVEDCRGTVDRACTSANGTRESGFHEARIEKSKLKMPEDIDIVFETPETPREDLFAPKPLTAKPKLKRSKKTKDDE